MQSARVHLGSRRHRIQARAIDLILRPTDSSPRDCSLSIKMSLYSEEPTMDLTKHFPCLLRCHCEILDGLRCQQSGNIDQKVKV